ncbi:hypothetical protein B0H66DRAFT_28401 [Apodospora peruviana]|uniref:Uncharacterized protein n=1 Tax=Apodospora peruviana TaxID=516989 RepID=A0AAE0IQN4_9PEZI|nr:hypothetical protein B0H66DRAFT_28401 [Apodospora peruviana]
MTEVTSYPHAHHRLGGSSQRLLAPSPEFRTSGLSSDIFRGIPLLPMDYHNQFGPMRPVSGDRSASASSSTSSASYSTPYKSISRTLSPASVASEPAVMARNHQQLPYSHHQQTTYPALAPASALITNNSTQYLQSQVGSQIPLYAQVQPAPRSFTHSAPFSFQLNSQPPQPSPLSFQSYPSIYSAFPSTPTYQHSSSGAFASFYPQPLPLLQLQASDDHDPSFLDRLQRLPPEALKLVRESVGYLDSTRLVQVNRWFRDNFHANLFSDEEKIAGVREVEQSFKRYFITPKQSGKEPDDVREKRSAIQVCGGRAAPDGRTRASVQQQITPRGSFGCYHCFRMKSPENFELFRWHCQSEEDDRDHSGGDDDADSTSTATAASTSSSISATTTPKQRHYSLPTSNPHYDPTITRTSILQEKAAAAAAAAAAKNRRSGSPSTTLTRTAGSGTVLGDGGSGGPGAATTRVKSFGIRRFCVDCGVRKRYYKPRDMIELHGARERESVRALWVCSCWQINVKPSVIRCEVCGDNMTFEAGGRRRR